MAKAKYQTREYLAAYRALKQAQARGEILMCVEPVCVMPSRAIQPWQRADVCHDPSGTVVRGPGPARCNRREGAARGNRKRGRVMRRAL